MTLSDHELLEHLRADRPAPDPRFTAELDARVERRFMKGPSDLAGRSVKGPTDLARLRRMLVPAFGLVASALVALVLVVPAINGSDDAGAPVGATPGGGSGAGLAEDSSGSQAGSAGTVALEAAPGGSESTPAPRTAAPPPLAADPRSERRIERYASLTLAPPAAELERVGDRIVRATDRAGGFVQSASMREDDTDTGGGLFVLRVPTARLQALLADLSRLAHVRQREQAVEDLTASFDRTRDLLERARAERRSLLRRLGNAETDEQARRLRARLDRVTRRIDARERALGRLRTRTQLATVEVTLVAAESDTGIAPPDDGRWGVGDAVADAVRLLEGLAGVLILVAALALPGLPLLLVAQSLQRRRRERALDLA